MSTLVIEVCLWYIGYVLMFILSLLLCLQYNLLFLWDIDFVTLQQANVTLQQNQCPIDTVNTPRIVVENTGCGIK